jgi:hypothetical protein
MLLIPSPNSPSAERKKFMNISSLLQKKEKDECDFSIPSTLAVSETRAGIAPTANG